MKQKHPAIAATGMGTQPTELEALRPRVVDDRRRHPINRRKSDNRHPSLLLVNALRSSPPKSLV